MKTLLMLLLLLGATAGPAATPETVDRENAIRLARRWLKSGAGERRRLEERLHAYRGDIDSVIQTITPQGDPKNAAIKGHEVRGDTFVTPRLLARNADHPFNFYVPPHYDAAKPMVALNYIALREDWGLIYHASITIEVPPTDR